MAHVREHWHWVKYCQRFRTKRFSDLFFLEEMAEHIQWRSFFCGIFVNHVAAVNIIIQLGTNHGTKEFEPESHLRLKFCPNRDQVVQLRLLLLHIGSTLCCTAVHLFVVGKPA